MTPQQFLEAMKNDSDNLGLALDGYLNSMKSKQGASIGAAAIKDFARVYRIRSFQLTVRIKLRRTREKRPVSWETVEKVINECPTPYREVFRFMLYGGLDENTFGKINWNEQWNGKAPLNEISEQMKNDKPYVKINLPPRKSSLDRYFILVPKVFVPEMPVRTKKFEGRGGELVAPQDLIAVWKRSARRLGVWYEGFGPHKIRTAFRTRCADLGIPVVGEWQLGHGGDKFGYDLSGLGENFLLDGPLEDGRRKGGLRRLWESGGFVDKQGMTSEIEQLKARLARYETRETAAERMERVWKEMVDRLPPEERAAYLAKVKAIEEKGARLLNRRDFFPRAKRRE